MVLLLMYYSTWKHSRWQICSLPASPAIKIKRLIQILHTNLLFEIRDVHNNINKCIEETVKAEEKLSNKKVYYKEKLELKKYFKRIIKDYIKSRLRKGFEYEIFTVK